jgi:hypothetical protein
MRMGRGEGEKGAWYFAKISIGLPLFRKFAIVKRELFFEEDNKTNNNVSSRNKQRSRVGARQDKD